MLGETDYNFGLEKVIWYNARKGALLRIEKWKEEFLYLKKEVGVAFDERYWISYNIFINDFWLRCSFLTTFLGSSLGFPVESLAKRELEASSEFADIIAETLISIAQNSPFFLQEYLLFHTAIKQYQLESEMFHGAFGNEFIGRQVDQSVFNFLQAQSIIF